MSAIKKILVPTDFSDASEAALKYACDLAETLNASLCVLHTVENPYPLGAYTEYYSPPQEFLDRCEREGRAGLEATRVSRGQEEVPGDVRAPERHCSSRDPAVPAGAPGR